MGRLFSTYVNVFENLTIFTPWYVYVRVRIWGKGMLVFQKVLCTYLIHYQIWDFGFAIHYKQEKVPLINWT